MRQNNSFWKIILSTIVITVTLGLFVLYLNPLQIEPGIIEGTVTDHDKKAVAGLNVYVFNGTNEFQNNIAETNSEGYYQIRNVPSGEFEVAVLDDAGNRIGVESVVVWSGKTSILNFVVWLRPYDF